MKVISRIFDPEKEDKNIILPSQVHGDRIVEVINGTEDISACDALLTKNKTLSLGVRTADCASICFSDGEKIGIVHAGWRGVCAQIVENMLNDFNQENLEVFVGPFLHEFEIKRDFCFDQISAKFGERFFKVDGSRIIFDFKSALASILPDSTVYDTRNTKDDLSLPSNRRDGTKERIITVISFG